jgi:hypothetical protein
MCVTGSVRTAHAAALEVLLGVQALHLVAEAESSTQLAGLVLSVCDWIYDMPGSLPG